ncbi:outer membrane protein [Legionella micdadei]|uniref:Outer membrane protein beta-barrel domain-containing protein n=1 Tax=Legionella micdadei TaxID=451 RepID=A0A098GF73_LEGMI|nr:hypothetical protein [Legionella micdadei]ARG97780.1 hypothetical protein B6N58_08970 [Legionella micdadei]ARG99904.1 hypothetical protein B6V88_05445 [Legionella micdadei]KTD28490.1 hypothetical protein Lmic_1601 [Legionella micdadei]NSL18741.1 porin family protein [Legionella micdadei]CEG60620.1 conserved exported protein of unknown function [Legionella micdadei]
MRHFLFPFFVTTSVIVSQASAGTMGLAVAPEDWAWVGSISVGPVWARGGETQTVCLSPETTQTYAASRSAHALASGELFIGFQKMLAFNWHGQLGIAAATTGNAKLQGVIWDDADPAFTNYSYRYKVRNSRVVVKGKLILDKGYWLIPWASGSVGVGFNRTYDFTNTPLILEALPITNFSNHSKTAFTYTLGVGVQKAISNHWQVGVGYEFADWGRSKLGVVSGQMTNSGLALNHLHTNGVLFNFTYVA